MTANPVKAGDEPRGYRARRSDMPVGLPIGSMEGVRISVRQVRITRRPPAVTHGSTRYKVAGSESYVSV